MNATLALLENSAVLALGWTLLHFLWQGAALGALLFLAQMTMRRSSANSRYVAACVAMFLMAACPLATFLLLNQSAAEPHWPIPNATAPISVQEKVVTVTPPIPNVATVFRQAPSISKTEGISAQLQRSLPWIVTGWLGVVCGLSLRLMLGYSRVRQIKNQAHESLGVFWTEKLLELSEQLCVSQPVRLCQSALVEVPTVIGWLQPVILFPTAALSGLTPGQLEAILAHELAHIRRHDYLVNLLQNLIETLLFYHPAIWWVSHHISIERELCCDDLTVKICGDRIEYARALATLEELREPAQGFALAAGGGSLLRRIRRLADAPVEANRSGWWLAGVIALGLAASLVFATRGALFAADDNAIPRIQNPASAVKRAWPQFRLVAREGDTGPADELEEQNLFSGQPRKLRVLKEVLLNGDAIESAKAESTGIVITLTKAGAKRFSQITEQNVSRRIAIVFDGRLLSAPQIGEKISGKQLIIRGAFAEAEAEAIASAINREDLGFGLLFGGLDLKESGRVIAALKQMKVPYQVKGWGTSIYISPDKVHSARMALAALGMPRNASVGFEIFNKPTNGMSDFILQANFMRALQGELERAISQLEGIESARVMIVTPESRLLIVPARKPSASVFLKLRGNGRPNPNTINAIRFLVANSVEGLKANDVRVTDSLGNVLDKSDSAASTNTLQGATSRTDAAAELVEEARVLLKLGKLDEVRAKLTEVTKRLSDNLPTGANLGKESKQENVAKPTSRLQSKFDFNLATCNTNLADITGKEVTRSNFNSSFNAFIQQLGIKINNREVKDGGFDLIYFDQDPNRASDSSTPSLFIMDVATEAEMNLVQRVIRLVNQDRAPSASATGPKNLGEKTEERSAVNSPPNPSSKVNLHAPNAAAIIEDARLLIKLGKWDEARIRLKEVTKRFSEYLPNGDQGPKGRGQTDPARPTNLISPGFDLNLATCIANLADLTGKEVSRTNFYSCLEGFFQQVGIRINQHDDQNQNLELLLFEDEDGKQASDNPNSTLWIKGPATDEEMNLIHAVVRLLNQDRAPSASATPPKKLDEKTEKKPQPVGPTNPSSQKAAPSADASTLVRDGRLLIELGKLDEAETKLNEAIKIAPDDKTAIAYRHLIIQLRASTKSQIESFLKEASNRTNVVHTSPARDRIREKLRSIVLDEVRYDDIPLAEVIKDLSEQARKIAPPGVNFIINSQAKSSNGQSVIIDPASGLSPSPAKTSTPIDLNQVAIRINPPLRNVRLEDVLDAITKVKDPKLRYSVEDYAIVIGVRTDELPQLFTRTFRLNPNALTGSLKKIVGEELVKTNLNAAIREFIRQGGVDLAGEQVQIGGGGIGDRSPNLIAPSLQGRKAVFYNDRTGTLFARATMEDLDSVEQSLQVLNVAPPQVMIDAKFVEMTDDATKALGFDWFLGNVPEKKPADADPNAAAGSGVFPQSKPQSNSVNNEGLQATNATVTGILTEAQFQAVLRALKQRLHVDILSSPKVTTLSGRKASVAVTQPKTVVVPKSFGLPKELNAKSDPENPVDSSAFTTNIIQVGDKIEVTPTVMTDGKSIQLQLTGKLVEFLGYDDPGPFQPRTVDGKTIDAPLRTVSPLPRFRIRQATCNATLWDGQTLVLGGFITREVSSMEKKVPVLGDIPLVGRMFRSEAKTNPNLLLFVTPTLIDPAGNRVHPSATSASDPNSISPNSGNPPIVKP